MAEAAGEAMGRFGYDGAPFNMEFYWDPRTDENRLPEVNARIHPLVEAGARLRHLHYQDSYIELADIFLGADGQPELLEKYRRALELPPFELDPPPAAV